MRVKIHGLGQGRLDLVIEEWGCMVHMSIPDQLIANVEQFERFRNGRGFRLLMMFVLSDCNSPCTPVLSRKAFSWKLLLVEARYWTNLCRD